MLKRDARPKSPKELELLEERLERAKLSPEAEKVAKEELKVGRFRPFGV